MSHTIPAPRRLSPVLFLGLLAACSHQSGPLATPAGDPLLAVTGDDLYRQGIRYSEAQEFVRAEQYLAAAIERGYPEAEAIRPLISVCVRGSRLSSALAYADPYLTRHPDDWPLRLLVATLLMSLGETLRAHEELTRVIREQPEEPAGHYLLAVLHRDTLENANAALPHFRRYLELAPEGEHSREAASAIELARLRAPSSSPLEGASPRGTGSDDDADSRLDDPRSDAANAGSSATQSGQPDAGQADTGHADAGQADTGHADADQADTGHADTGPADAHQADTGHADTGHADTGGDDNALPQRIRFRESTESSQ